MINLKIYEIVKFSVLFLKNKDFFEILIFFLIYIFYKRPYNLRNNFDILQKI